ncbi:MAG: hypothetical protein RIK87_21875 [Fuerstiella sp.]
MSQQTESILNSVLIDMARSLLQYVAESWPWVRGDAQSVEEQVLVIAARQRQDVADIAALLTKREHYIDFGSFPTEYTDLQFLALSTLFEWLHNSQATVLASIQTGLQKVRDAGDSEAAELLTAVETRQQEAATALKELEQQLSGSSAPA